MTSDNTCGICLVDFPTPEARFTHEVIEHGQNVDPALKRKGSRAQVTQQFHNRLHRPPARPFNGVPPHELMRRNGAPVPAPAPAPPQRLGGLRIKPPSELMAAPVPQRGKISIRPVHTLQAQGSHSQCIQSHPPPLTHRLSVAPPPRMPVMGSGYVMVPANVNGRGPPLYYMVRPEQLNPVTGALPQVMLSSLPTLAPRAPPRYFCKTCGSEFSTLLNLKLHVNVMKHQLPDGVDDGVVATAGGLDSILQQPGLEKDEPQVGEQNVVKEDHLSKWMKGRTEIRKRKLPEGTYRLLTSFKGNYL